MKMRKAPFEIIAGLMLILNPTDVAAEKNSRIKLARSKGAVSIVFHDKGGKATKTISRPIGEREEKGRRVRRGAQALVNPDNTYIVLSEETQEMDEKNPYAIRRSSAVHLSWYDGEGKLICNMQTRMKPKKLANNGQALVATDLGIEPTMFEQWHEVPGLKSVDQLRNDESLTSSTLYVLNNSCQVIFSTTSANGGWEDILISSSGRWLLYSKEHSGVAVPGKGWKNFLTATDTKTGTAFVIDRDRDISPKTISDEGLISGEKYLGTGAVYSYRSPNGQERKARRRRLQRFEWAPGSGAFVSKGPEVEEQ